MSPKVTAQLTERTFKYILNVDHACWQNLSLNICFNFLSFCSLYKDEITIDTGGTGICLTRALLITCDGVTSLMSWRGKWKLKIRPLFWKIFLILHKFFNAIFYDKNGKVGFLTPSICQAANRVFFRRPRCWSKVCVWHGPMHVQTERGHRRWRWKHSVKLFSPLLSQQKKISQMYTSFWNIKWRCNDCSSWDLACRT